MKVLVSGGAGYIGSHTVALLKLKGHHVVVLDSLEKGHRGAIPPDVPFYEGEVSDVDLLRKIMTEHMLEGVIHFAGYTEVGESVEKPGKYFQNNFVAAKALVDCCVEFNVPRFVFSSTAAVYGIPEEIPISEEVAKKPINPYGQSKLAFEYLLESYANAHSISCVALRYFNAAGAGLEVGEDHDPETHLIPIILQVALGKRSHLKIFGEDYDTPDGTCVRDYIHVLDLAEAHVLALEKIEGGFHALNLGNGVGYSVRQIIEVAREVTEREIKTEPADRRPGDPDILVADPTKAKDLLGWNPTRSLEEIITSAWEWHSSHPDGY